MPKLLHLSVLLLAVTGSGLQSCSGDDNNELSDLEKIDSLSLQLTAPGKDPVDLTFVDTDGDRIFQAQTSPSLSSNTTYTASFSFIGSRDGSSAAIDQNMESHLICYRASNEHLQIEYMDVDLNNLPVGLTTHWTTIPDAYVNLVMTMAHHVTSKEGNCEEDDVEDDVLDFKLIQDFRIKDDITANEAEDINEVYIEIYFDNTSFEPLAITFTDSNNDGIFQSDWPLLELKTGSINRIDIWATTYRQGDVNTPVRIDEKIDDHIFCSEVTNGVLLNPQAAEWDFDSNDLRKGMYTLWTTSSLAGTTGTLKITLRHQPGIKTGECPGEGQIVDFEITQSIKTYSP
jgi:hypothetical protein